MRKIRPALMTAVVLFIASLLCSAVFAASATDSNMKDIPGFSTVFTGRDGMEYEYTGVPDFAAPKSSLFFSHYTSYSVRYDGATLLETEIHGVSAPAVPGLFMAAAPAQLNRYYTAEFMIDETNQVFLTGLTENTLAQVQRELVASALEDRYFYMTNVEFIDAEKEITVVLPDGTEDYDSSLCWAAATSNILHYTGWGAQAGFDDEDELFEAFIAAFDDNGSNYSVGFDWFFNGKNTYQTTYGTAHAERYDGSFTGFLPQYSAVSLYRQIELNKNTENLSAVLEYLRDGYGVGVSVGWYLGGTLRQGGHAVTLWGYMQDLSADPGSKEAYPALFLSDSDSDKVNYQPRRAAPNCLRIVMMSDFNNGINDTWVLDYPISMLYNGLLERMTVLMPYSPDLEQEQTGTMDLFRSPDYFISSARISNQYTKSSFLSLRTFSENDTLTLTVTAENLALIKASGSIEVTGQIKNGESCIMPIYISYAKGIAQCGSVELSFEIGSLPAGHYDAELHISPVGEALEAYRYNNDFSFSFTVSDVSYNCNGASLTAELGPMNADGGDCALTLHDFDLIEPSIDVKKYVLFTSYNVGSGWINWSYHSTYTEMPESIYLKTMGDYQKILLVIVPTDPDLPLCFLQAGPFELIYTKINVWASTGTPSQLSPVPHNAVSFTNEESLSFWYYNDSTTSEPLLADIRIFARRQVDGLEVTLWQTEDPLLMEQGFGTLFSPTVFSSWSDPLPNGSYTIYGSSAWEGGYNEKSLTKINVDFSDDLQEAVVLYSTVSSTLNNSIAILTALQAPPADADSVSLEYGFADSDETSTIRGYEKYASRTAERSFSFSIPAFPDQDYRFRPCYTCSGGTVYGEWSIVHSPDVARTELTLDEPVTVSSDDSSIYFYFSYTAETPGTYIVFCETESPTGSVNAVNARDRSWGSAVYLSPGIPRGTPLHLKAGDRAMIRLNNTSGDYSVCIKGLSVTEVGDPAILSVIPRDKVMTVSVIAAVPHAKTCSIGIEYGLSTTHTVSMKKTAETSGEQFTASFLPIMTSDRDWYIRAFITDEETGKTNYSDWQTTRAVSGAYPVLISDQEQRIPPAPGSASLVLSFVAPHSGRFTLKVDASMCRVRFMEYAYPKWSGYIYMGDWYDSEYDIWAQEGDPVYIDFYSYSDSESATLTFCSNSIRSAVRDGNAVRVTYLPDFAGWHLIALYDAGGRMLAAQDVLIDDPSDVIEQVVPCNAGAVSVSVFQLDDCYSPQTCVLNAAIS